MKIIKRGLPLLISAILFHTGCLIVVAEGDDREERRERKDSKAQAEEACMAQLPAQRLEGTYVARTDCGGANQTFIQLSALTYDHEAAKKNERWAITGELATTDGGGAFEVMKFTSDCAATQPQVRFELPLGQGDDASAHAFFQCGYDLNRAGQEQSCMMLLRDGKVIDEDACRMTMRVIE